MAFFAVEIDIITIFPEICTGALGASIMGRAQESGRVRITAHDLRKWTHDRHRTTDSPPYGGGQGMVMRIEPIYEALEELRREDSFVVLLSAQGEPFRQARAVEMAERGGHLILLCGHYEGVDQRVADHLVDLELSIGDYVLTNGALAAAVVVDAVVRLLPGVLGDERSARDDSFMKGRLDHPHYTRPEVFNGWRVPEVLLSGNHAAIEKWREQAAWELTRKRRPDLLKPDEKG